MKTTWKFVRPTTVAGVFYALLKNATKWLFALLTVMCVADHSYASARAKLAQEVAEFLVKKGSKEALETGAQALAKKIEAAAIKHGDDIFQAVRKVGPKALHLVEHSGLHGAKASKILATHGEHGAVWILERPAAMKLVSRHGDDVVHALVRHPGGIAEPLIEHAGKHAVEAFCHVGSQSGRRLAIMAAEKETAHIATDPKVLNLLASHSKPDAVMDFLYRHRKVLLTTTAVATVVTHVDEFIDGTRDIAEIAAVNIGKPLAEVPGKAVEKTVDGLVPHVGASTNWTMVFLGGWAMLLLLLGVVGGTWWLYRKTMR